MGNENLGNGKVDQKKNSIGFESTSKQCKIKLNMSEEATNIETT